MTPDRSERAGLVGGDDWTTTKPTEPGVYRVRGWAIGRRMETAVVVVVLRNDELRCNLHERNSDCDVRDWSFVADMNDGFEWQRVDALATHPGVSREWLPIESAPKDGTRILVDFGPRAGIHAATWEESASGLVLWCVDDNKFGPYVVRGYNDEDIRGWLPLPAPSAAPSDGVAP